MFSALSVVGGHLLSRLVDIKTAGWIAGIPNWVLLFAVPGTGTPTDAWHYVIDRELGRRLADKQFADWQTAILLKKTVGDHLIPTMSVPPRWFDGTPVPVHLRVSMHARWTFINSIAIRWKIETNNCSFVSADGREQTALFVFTNEDGYRLSGGSEVLELSATCQMQSRNGEWLDLQAQSITGRTSLQTDYENAVVGVERACYEVLNIPTLSISSLGVQVSDRPDSGLVIAVQFMLLADDECVAKASGVLWGGAHRRFNWEYDVIRGTSDVGTLLYSESVIVLHSGERRQLRLRMRECYECLAAEQGLWDQMGAGLRMWRGDCEIPLVVDDRTGGGLWLVPVLR